MRLRINWVFGCGFNALYGHGWARVTCTSGEEGDEHSIGDFCPIN